MPFGHSSLQGCVPSSFRYRDGRIQSQHWGVQADGPRALWSTKVFV